jgi:hypothetical protein
LGESASVKSKILISVTTLGVRHQERIQEVLGLGSKKKKVRSPYIVRCVVTLNEDGA